jgi:hypothetical protein
VIARGIFLAAACALALGCDGADKSVAGAPIEFDMSTDVAVGAERYTCMFVKMPDTGGEIFVGGGSYTTTPGTHHFLLFRTAKDMPTPTYDTPVDCNEGDGVMQYERGYVTGGQLPSDSAEFPAGLGLPFESGETLLFEGHFLDASSAAELASIHVELDTVDPSTILDRVGTFRFYDPFIYLAPRASAKAAMRCHIHEDVTLISAGSHMHERGVGYSAFVDQPGQGFSAAPFFTTSDWQHPTPWEGATSLTSGSALRFECDYDNPSDGVIVQGPSATANEMCMLAGFYFPEQDAAEEDCTSMDMHGTGARTCAETASCVALCPPSEAPNFSPGSAAVGPCWQQCVVDSCPNVTEALFPELECEEAKCKAACQTAGLACSQCLEVDCKQELDTCQALACGE